MSDTEKQTVTAADVGEVPAELVKKPNKSPRAAALKAELQKDKDRLEAELKDYREFHDRHVNDPKYLECCKKIREINGKLGPINNELAALARVDAGNRGIRAEAGEVGVKTGG